MEEPSNLELLVREDVALQQLVLASMGNNPLVVQHAVSIMSAVGAYAGAAQRLVKHNVVRAITGMLASGDKVRVFLVDGVCKWERCSTATVLYWRERSQQPRPPPFSHNTALFFFPFSPHLPAPTHTPTPSPTVPAAVWPARAVQPSCWCC